MLHHPGGYRRQPRLADRNDPDVEARRARRLVCQSPVRDSGGDRGNDPVLVREFVRFVRTYGASNI